MKIEKIRLVLALCFTLVSQGWGAFIANRDFLSVGHGARANAMGEAFVAVSDDVSAIYWNPAGLTQLRSNEVSTSFADRFDGLSSDAQVHFAKRGPKAMWGFGYVGAYVKDIPVTNSLTQADLDAILAGTFASANNNTRTVYDHAALISYARPIVPESRHALGATVKLIYRDMLGMVRGYGTAVDVGYHYSSLSGNWRFGSNLQNAASIVSFVGDIDNLGVKATATESYIPTLKTGFAYQPSWRILNGRMLLAADVDMQTSFEVEDYRAGIEYAFGDNVAIRAGKIFGRQDDSSQDYTMGLGLRFKSLSLDFSFLASELGDTTRGTISYRLGEDYYTPRQYESR